MKKKQAKNLKSGDILYLLDTKNYSVSVGYVESLEKDGCEDDLKVIWREGDNNSLLSYGFASKDDTIFFEELDCDSFDHNERYVFLNREDVISWMEERISWIINNLNELS